MFRFFTLIAVCALVALQTACSPDSRHLGKGPHIEVALISDQTAVTPGVPFYIGVHFKPEAGWHIYWKNPGDSGLAPKFTWETPPGLTLDAPLWPTPSRIELGPLVNYGYDETLLSFPASFTSAQISPKSIEVTVSAQWLVCKDECLPGSAKMTIPLQVVRSGAPLPSQHTNLFATYLSKVPPPLERAAIAIEERESHLLLSVLPLEQRTLPRDVLFFPEDPRVISNSARQVTSIDGNTLHLMLERDSSHSEPIERVRGVLFSAQGWSESGEPKAVSIDTDREAQSNAALPSLHIKAEGSSPPKVANDASDSLAITLLLALAGGLILNLMPCVFPVLSIKILGFVQCSKEAPHEIRRHGIAFTAGVITSFLLLASLLLALRAGSAQLGWGFQFQSPVFVLVMIGVFFLLGLTFLVELNFGSSVQTLACKGKLPPSVYGSFLNGVLATAVATPCTGPFMGSALAATITMPAFQSLIVFTTIGLGMSIPYLALSFRPALLCFLPRPGVWMVVFKQAMAFPLFATAIWLCGVFGRQVGNSAGSLSLLIHVLWGLLFLSVAIWVLTHSQHVRSRIGRILGNLVAAACVGISVWMAYPTESALQVGRGSLGHSNSGAANSIEVDPFGLAWEKYSAPRLEELLRSGVPIYLDFTAEWCITCKVNERVAFGSSEVREMLRKKNVVLLKGDWTSMDGSITSALEKFGRNSVPLNVLYRGGAQNKNPHVFPNVLSPGIVLQELKKIQGVEE